MNNDNIIEISNLKKRTWINLHSDYAIDPHEDVVVSMFQIPIAHVRVKDWEKKKSKLLKLYENTISNSISGNEFDVSTDYHYNEECDGQSSYRETINSLLDEELATLENLLLPPDHYSGNYTEDIGTGVFSISNVWFENSKKYEQHYPHNHGYRGFSCVLYVNYDPEEHDPTVYLNPFTNYFYGSNQDWSCPEAQEGSLLCWPSSITHFTHPNSSNKDRLVLSWNMNPVNEHGDILQ